MAGGGFGLAITSELLVSVTSMCSARAKGDPPQPHQAPRRARRSPFCARGEAKVSCGPRGRDPHKFIDHRSHLPQVDDALQSKPLRRGRKADWTIREDRLLFAQRLRRTPIRKLEVHGRSSEACQLRWKREISKHVDANLLALADTTVIMGH